MEVSTQPKENYRHEQTLSTIPQSISHVSFSEKRAFQRTFSRVTSGSTIHTYRRSLQSVSVGSNLSKLKRLRDSTKSIALHNKIDALSCVLEDLLHNCNLESIDPTIVDRHANKLANGILDFQVGLDIYADFIGAPLYVRKDDLSTRFQDDLLDPVHGIRCIIYHPQKSEKKYIILDSDEMDILGILQRITAEFEDAENFRLPVQGNIDYAYINAALKTLETEHDRGIVKCILAKLISRTDMLAVGINPDVALKKLEKSRQIFEEMSNAKMAAQDMIELRLKGKIDKCKEKLAAIDKTIQSKTLSVMREKDVCAKKEILEEQLYANEKLLSKESSYDKQKYGYCIKRLTEKLIKENRIKSRRLGAGARPMLDSDDEEFIANAIESKSSAHGRRHDNVLYLNHRVKLEDLLSIANYNLIRRGKKLLKSAKTVHLRARPRKINTIEGKRHKGNWLFCTKKPPKTEDHSTELTHHQRAHVKLNREDMFNTKSLFRNSSLDISFDDKAYIRPGTDVGLRDTKAGKILTLTDESKQRKLPQHDFATPEVYQTPSSFRLLTWKTDTIHGKERMIKDQDNSLVVVRPKFYVGSTGCVWASDLLRLRYEKPNLFEMCTEQGESLQEKQFYAMVHDAAFYVFDSTTNDDLTSLLSGQSNYKHYESERITHFACRLGHIMAKFPNVGSDELIDKLKEVLQLIKKLNDNLKGEDMRICNRNLKKLRDQCEEIVCSISSMNLYPVKPVISEYTDGGPGVGVSNTAVKFRFAEMCRIQNSVRRVRIHRASGDSAQNEAERTNSSIGDALVDGATICWEYFKPLHGLSGEELDAMSPSDLDKHKAAMMEKNAWTVAEEVSLRIDDAKGPAGFIQSYVTERPEDQFFWNGNYLKQYHDSSKSAKATAPGHGYFKKIYDFIDQHFEVGELYIEYRKYRCEQSHGTKCEYCLKSPVNDLFGPNMVKPVPRPYPDYNRLPDLHYLAHSNTPVHIDNAEREPDDFQPRANMKKLFALGELSTSNLASVSEFSKKYVIPEDLVTKFVLHLETLKAEKERRSIATQKKKQDETCKTYDEYNWVELFENNLIDKQTISVLDKYILYHSLGNFTLKCEKVKAVKQSIAMNLVADNNQVNESQSDEDDIIIELFDPGTDTDNSSSSSDSEMEIENLQISTRSRRVRLPKRYDDYVF